MKPLGVKLWSLSGSSSEIGRQHGCILREEIRDNFDFYTKVLLKNRSTDLEAFGSAYLETVRAYFPEFCDEMLGIAEGAGLEPWKIGLLNARTELFLTDMANPPGECTSLFLRQSGLMGQTWDWMQPLEKNFTLFKVSRSGKPVLVCLTEPGIIGKIGLNEHGLGVCLNILIGKLRVRGVPIHVLCRGVLECRSLEEVEALLTRVDVGTCSHLLIAKDRRFLSLEFADNARVQLNYGEDPVVHTNHYLAMESDVQTPDPGREGSQIRLARMRSLLDESPEENLERLYALLRDEENGDNAICRRYQPFLGQILGTVALVMMDLERREFYYSPGAPHCHGLERVAL